MGYSIRIRFGNNNEIEAEGNNVDEVAELVNRATKKFFDGTTWASNEM